MRLLALTALTALIAMTALAAAECPTSLEPRDKTVLRLEHPMTWTEAADACVDIAPGFGMLGKDFLVISGKDWDLCGNLSVPLGLRGTQEGDIVWGTETCLNCFDVKEDVNATYLKLKEPEKRTKTSDSNRVGSLDTKTRRWRLVAGNTSFACAICQRAWLNWPSQAKKVAPRRPTPFLRAYTFRVVKDEGENTTVMDGVRMVTQHFSRSAIRVEIEIVDDDGDDGNNGTLLRLKSTNLTADTSVASVLNSSFAVEEWQDKDWCPAERFEGFDWPAEIVGNMSEKRLTDFNVATRRCVAEHRGADGDFDAVWGNDVAFWIDRGAECKSRPIKNVLRSLERFVARPPLDLSVALQTLVSITAAIPGIEWPLTNPEAFYPQRSSFSRAILNALSLLLAGAEDSSEFTGPRCASRTGALVTGDLQAATGSYAVLLKDADFCEFVDAHVVNRTPFIGLRIPALLAASGRVALHTFRGRDVGKAPLFKPVHDFDFAASTAVVVYATSSTPLAAWRLEGKWPVTFEVDNRLPTNKFKRYFSVWGLSDSEVSTRPCPLTKSEGSVDTFVCTSFESDDQNFTTGTFLILRAIKSRENELFRFADRLIEAYTEAPVDESALRAATYLISRLIDVNELKSHSSISGSTLVVAHSNGTLARLLHGVVLSDVAVVTATERHVKLLVSDLDATAPVIGFSIDRLAGNGTTVKTISTASRNNVSADSEVDVVLSAGCEQRFERLEAIAVTNSENFRTVGAFLLSKKLVEVNLALFPRSKLDATPEDAVFPVYFEIRLRADRVGVIGHVAINRRLLVATWSVGTSDWSVSSCEKLRSTRGAKQVFRCALPDDVDDVLRGRYLVFEPVGFAEVFGTPLLAVLIAAGALSGVSLGSIAGAAAFLPAWRQDVGHKILLQMTLALSFNLALGFTSSLVSIDTASDECVAVGALRHFSYLAMFSWMLVMSGLQLKRLLSVLGARNTPNLLLKVAIFAWGLPTLTVASLVYFNHDIYVSVAADRGFCYPEGVAFVWTVQAPAATILTLNALIFVVIVARLYGFRGWGETEDLRRHLNERAFQMYRLRAVFFTFCLFGMSWAFHLLAEQGVFRKKFLYEYLFLMTASVHLFSLSCIFVFFEQETRSELFKLFAPRVPSISKSKGGVAVRLLSWISPTVTSLMTCLVTLKDKTVCHASEEDSEHRSGGVYKRRASSSSLSWKQR